MSGRKKQSCRELDGDHFYVLEIEFGEKSFDPLLWQFFLRLSHFWPKNAKITKLKIFASGGFSTNTYLIKMQQSIKIKDF